MKSGIYEIVCAANSCRYVGSSVDTRKRLYEHRRQLRDDVHTNIRLQRTWKKYGAESFVFRVIESVPQPQLLEREQVHMDATPRRRLMNARLWAEANYGVRHRAPAKARIAAAVRVRMQDPANRAKARAILGAAQTKEQLSANAKWKRQPENIEALASVRRSLFASDPAIKAQVLAAGRASALKRTQKTHCKRGHEFTPENTHRTAKQRQCRKCSAERMAGYRERRRIA